MEDGRNISREFQPILPINGERWPGEWRDISELTREELLGELTLAKIAADEAKQRLDQTATAARDAGASWTEIGKATSITQQSAYQRWSPNGRAKHREYTRKSRAKNATQATDNPTDE